MGTEHNTHSADAHRSPARPHLCGHCSDPVNHASASTASQAPATPTGPANLLTLILFPALGPCCLLRRLSVDSERSGGAPRVFTRRDARLMAGHGNAGPAVPPELLNSEFVRKYIIYARRRCVVVWPGEVCDGMVMGRPVASVMMPAGFKLGFLGAEVEIVQSLRLGVRPHAWSFSTIAHSSLARRYGREGVKISIEDEAAADIVEYYAELRRLSKDR